MKVAWLHVAPVKSLAIETRDHVELGIDGVQDDRRFCLIDEDGQLINGKRVAELTTIGAHFDRATDRLELCMPGGARVAGTVAVGDPITIKGKDASGRLVEGPWSSALSEQLDRTIRLVRLDDPGHDRARKRGGVSLLSLASLHRLADEANVDSVDPRRFRMLIGVDGATAHEEDGWIGKHVRVGEAIVVPAGNVGRCQVTTLDPDRGVSDLDTLALLAGYRGEFQTTEPLPFGIWARVERPGRIALGDVITVEAAE